MGMFLNCILCSAFFVSGCISLRDILVSSDNWVACISAIIHFACEMAYWKGTKEE